MHNTLKIEFSRTLQSVIRVGRVADELPSLLPSGRVIAIVDRNVSHLCKALSIGEYIEVEASEEKKTLASAERILQQLVDMKADRDTFLLGIGGGITTDLVGFVAATYMRGVKFGLVPTTLLAQVDAAIGGKCGVNFGGYKNMVGAFAPALFVVCDVELLRSLGPREVRSGMAEVIKTAIIGDADLFALCEQNTTESLTANTSLFDEVVRRAAAVKCDIVGRDLLESGERRKLNLGHTLAHAIESLTHDFTHGEAVAIGLVEAARRSLEVGVMTQSDYQRIVELLLRYELPTHTDLPSEALEAAMSHDKKTSAGTLRWVLPITIGRVEN